MYDKQFRFNEDGEFKILLFGDPQAVFPSYTDSMRLVYIKPYIRIFFL